MHLRACYRRAFADQRHRLRTRPMVACVMGAINEGLEVLPLPVYAIGMQAKHSRQYTLRGIPASVDSALRQRARREGKSLNRTAVDLLAEGLGVSGEPVRHDDLDDLIGTWEDDPDFDKAIMEMDKVDPHLWRQTRLCGSSLAPIATGTSAPG